jgi:HEAT repeat protein
MRCSRVGYAVMAAAFLACSSAAAAAEEAASAAASSTSDSDAAAEARERTRQILAYGIDSQVLEVVARLRAARDADFTSELAGLLATSRSPEVRRGVLELFTELGIRDGEAAARAIVAGSETGDAGLTAAAAAYLASQHAEGLAALLLPLVDAGDAVVCSAALRAIGASRDPAAVEPLLAKLASVEFPDARKGDLVVALGELRDARAVDVLLRIAKGRDEEKTRRLYAADALGKIGDRRALPVLKALFEEDDALLRAYAASALAAFGTAEALPSLLAGLRDANVKVRLQCLKALARGLAADEAAQVVPVVQWKAENDPDRTVRLESVRTLGAIADRPSVAFLGTLLASGTAALDFREAALSALLARTPGSPAIAAAVEQEIAAKDQKPIEMIARVLSAAKARELAPVLMRLLDCQGYTVRIWAVRGLAANGVTAALERIGEMAEKDPVAAVRTEAARAKERLSASPAAPTSSAR